MNESESAPGQAHVLSFRHLLSESVEHFLADAGMPCAQTADALSELIVTLSRYHEEGAPLFPMAFVGDDLPAMLGLLGGTEPIAIGTGPRTRDTIQRALKQCALLGQGRWWALYLLRVPEGFAYGIFRTDPFPLAETPPERLRRLGGGGARVVGVLQLAENVLELCAGGGLSRRIYMSGAGADASPATQALDDLAHAATVDVAPALREAARSFFHRVLFEVMQGSHGALVAVLPRESARSSLFVDGVILDEPVDTVARIQRYLAEPGDASASSVRAAAQLLRGMMATDGVTVLRSDGCVVGYHVFVRHPASSSHVPALVGGARRRTFEVLCASLGTELIAAFMRSQDGAVAFRGK